MGAPPTRREKPWERGWPACGLCVNKIADATLEIENPIETAVSRGASLVELKRLRFPESGK